MAWKDRRVPCDECNGRGLKHHRRSFWECEKCDGYGSIPSVESTEGEFNHRECRLPNNIDLSSVDLNGTISGALRKGGL